MNRLRRLLRAGAAAAIIVGAASPASAQFAPSLGAAQGFAVVAASTVTNTGPTVITGDLGLSPGTSVTGFPPGTFASGGIHAGDALALAAQGAVGLAYDSLVGQPCTQDLTGQNLGGLTLTPGVYCFTAAAQLTGNLTLNGGGNPAAVFIFKIGSTLTTSSGATVNITGGASPCGLFWQVGSSVTLGTGTLMAGNLLAQSSITVTSGASLIGRALARTGAVTLDTSTLTAACATAPVCPAITLTPALIPAGVIGVPYSQLLTGNGGTGPYSFSVTAGTPPAGLTLAANGVLSGTPTTAATSTFTVRAADVNACGGSLSYAITVATSGPGCPALTITPGALPNGRVSAPYTQPIIASGGTAPYTFSVSTGVLPAGLSLTSAGLLAGTPTAAATSSFTVLASDVNACGASLPYTMLIAAAGPSCPTITLAPTTLPNGRVLTPYSQTITASGGTGPYIFTLTAGSLPAGLTLTPTGVLAGTPTSSGTATVTMRGTDANGCFAEVAVTLVIAAAGPSCPTITLAPSTLPNGRVSTPYSQAIVGNGGTGPYIFTLSAGTLPVGLTLTPSGVLAGTPTSSGTATFTIRGTDANGCFAEVAMTMVIAAAGPSCPAITLTPATLPNGTVSVLYNQTIVGSGGTGPYTFTLATGTLPQGLTLTAGGVLAGTPTAGGTSTFTVRGTDVNGCFAEVPVTMLIATPVPTLPQAFVLLLALALAAVGYFRMRGRARAS